MKVGILLNVIMKRVISPCLKFIVKPHDFQLNIFQTEPINGSMTQRYNFFVNSTLFFNEFTKKSYKKFIIYNHQTLQAIAEDNLDILLIEGHEAGQNTAIACLACHHGYVFVADAQFGERALELQGVEQEVLGLLDGLAGNVHRWLVGIDTEHIHAILHILAHGLLAQAVFHPPRGDDGKAQSMGDVIERRHLMLHGMAAPCLALAAVHKAVDGP